MKLPLTIQVIVKNNEHQIEQMLESIAPLNASILIGDVGSRDSTINKCLKFKAKIVKLHLSNDMSLVRNHLMTSSSTSWNLYLEPWEIFLSGQELLKEYLTKEPSLYKFNILEGDLITKQTRLWHKEKKVKFKNPVFEFLEGQAKISEVYLSSGAKDSKEEMLEKWLQDKPLLNDPIYYKSFNELMKGNWDSFLNYANIYLHGMKTINTSVIMTYYYISMVNCYIKKDYNQAVKYIIMCLANKPTMAEFWCMLGDIYYSLKDYKKAKNFYENGIILGSKRSSSDEYPIEISKYKEYPEKMILSCDEIKKTSIYYAPNKLYPND